MKKDDIQSSSDMYLYKAQVDLNSAKYLLEAFNNNTIEIDIEKIYFDLQQCAEKILKSFLSKEDILFPRTHDIEHLIEICQENELQLIQDIDELIELSDYAVNGRYAIIHDDINEAQKYIIILEKMI